MTQLEELLQVAADNTAGVFALSANTLAVLYFLLQQGENLGLWQSYPGEEISATDIDQIDKLIGVATFEVMNMAKVTPIGTLSMWVTDTPPDDWLACDGTEVNRADFPELFDVIGETFGAGDGSTTFRLPDLQGRSPMGTGEIVLGVGDIYGEQWHTLTVDEMPSHNHGVTDFGHAHRIPKASATVNAAVNTSSPNARTDNPATPTMSTDVGQTGISIEPRGNSASHNTVHPVIGLVFIIFAGVTL